MKPVQLMKILVLCAVIGLLIGWRWTGARFTDYSAVAHPTEFIEVAAWTPGARGFVGVVEGKKCVEVRSWSAANRSTLVTARAESLNDIEIAFSPDGAIAGAAVQTTVDAVDATEVRLWRIFDGATLGGIRLPYRVTSLALSPDGQTFAVILGDCRTVEIWNQILNARLRAFRSYEPLCTELRFAPNGNQIAVGSMHGSLTLWNPHTGKLICRFYEQNKGVCAIAFSSTGDLIACGDTNKKLRVWNTSTGRLIHDISVSTTVQSVSFSPDGHTLVAGTTAPDASGSVILWDMHSGQIKNKFVGPGSVVDSVSFSEDGASIVAASLGGNTRSWRIQ